VEGGVWGAVSDGSCNSAFPEKADPAGTRPAAKCESSYCVQGLGEADGTYTEFTDYNGKSAYRNGSSSCFLFWSSYFDETTKYPDEALDAPMGTGSYSGSLDVISLQARVYDGSSPAGGTIILKFSDNMVVSGPGDDFTIFENVFYVNGDESKRFMEPAVVSVSQDGIDYYRFPFDYVPHYNADGSLNFYNPYSYMDGDGTVRGFAGIHPVFSYNRSPDPRDPDQAGGDSFDLDDITARELTWIQYLKIQATGDNWLADRNGDKVRHIRESGACSGAGSSGFDLDAVCTQCLDTDEEK
jgi:hypothetical protein